MGNRARAGWGWRVALMVVLSLRGGGPVVWGQTSFSPDRNDDGRVDDTELLAAIDAWAGGELDDFALLAAIDWWAASPTGPAWTILIFMNADNDLEPFAIQDMNELERVGSSDRVHLLVQFDRSPGYDRSNGDWQDTRRFRVLRDDDPSTITSPVLEFMGEVDMGDPLQVREFIEWGQQHYPAERYLLVFWNHGSGWRQARRATDPIRRALSFDDSQHSRIAVSQLPSALEVRPSLDLVVFDASLMQMMEVAYEIRHHCDFVVGSEESPPGEGYPYDAWVGPLVRNPTLLPEQLATLIVEETVRQLGPRFDVTQSAVRTERLPALALALDELAGSLLATGSRYREAVRTARSEAQHYGYDSGQFAEYKDLLDYAQRVARGTGDVTIAAKVDAVAQALAAALVAEAHAGSKVAGSHGLSIWVPRPADFLSRYRNLSFASDTRWDEWINTQGE